MVLPMTESKSVIITVILGSDGRQVNESASFSASFVSHRESFLAPCRPKEAYSARSFCISGSFRPLGFHPVTVRHYESLAHFPWRHTCCFLLGCGTRSKHSGSASTAGVG